LTRQVGKFNDKVKGNIYSAGGSWAHLEENKVKSSGGLQPALEKPEIDRLAELQAWWISTTGEQPQAGGTTQAHGANSGGNSKMVSLGQVQPNMFFSAVFKVSPAPLEVLTIRYSTLNKAGLYTTSYTSPMERFRPCPFAIGIKQVTQIYPQPASSVST
jgi:hypothetical protein